MSKFTVRYEKTCATCGKEFAASSRRAMFCSRACKSKSYIVHKQDKETGLWPKECVKCGKPFSAVAKNTTMCPECASASQKESYRKWRTNNPDWQKNWNKEHPESLKQSKMKWNDANPDKVAAYEKAHTERRKETRLEDRRQRALKKQETLKTTAKKYGPISEKKRNEFLDTLGIVRLTANECLCTRCGTQFTVANTVTSAYRNLVKRIADGKTPCPKCGTAPIGCHYSQDGSRYEKELAELYPNLSVKHYKPDWMEGKEIDLFDPVAKVGVEFHGIYNHSTRSEHRPGYHKLKADLCEKTGIQLVQIYETEWVQRRECVIDKLDAIFHRNMRKVFARKLTVRELNDTKGREIANRFMDENHIQGHTSSQWAVGLFDGDTPVAVCCFKFGTGYAMNGRATKQYWELNRYASRLHTSVVGGISRCIRAFEVEHPEATSIVSFADRRWTCPVRSAYSSSGFVETGRILQNYLYTDLDPKHPLRNKQFMRKGNIEKRALLDPEGPEAKVFSWSKTETAMSEELGFYKIYDAGKIRYEKQINR